MQHPAHRIGVVALLVAIALLAMHSEGRGQGRGNQQPSAPPSARAAAPFDPTGYWSSLITQNWRLRMVPPGKGDYIGIPVSAAGKKAADAWDQAKDEAAGNQCKAYGAPGLMNLPTHLHITWQDDDTLRVETDYGTQTRTLHFGSWTRPQPQKRSWQGNSVAVWASRRGGRGGSPSARYLRITTTDLLSGYLRKNGVPYSENATMEEFFDAFTEPNGDSWLVIDTIVTDPTYLTQPYVNSVAFRKQRDSSGWDPTPCRTDQPR